MPNDTIGIFYELPNGKIAKTTGWNGRQKVVSYYFEGGHPMEISEKEFQTWKPRPDLRDFPNAKDPLLPRLFDLIWDIKYTSELKRILAEGDHDDLADIKAEIWVHGLEDQFGLKTEPFQFDVKYTVKACSQCPHYLEHVEDTPECRDSKFTFGPELYLSGIDVNKEIHPECPNRPENKR